MKNAVLRSMAVVKIKKLRLAVLKIDTHVMVLEGRRAKKKHSECVTAGCREPQMPHWEHQVCREFQFKTL